MEIRRDWIYYHADGLGSITTLTSHMGNVVQRYDYDSFGNMSLKPHFIKQPYTYTAREFDSETGLYYYRARYYDAKAGRFITKDPIGFDGGEYNLFVYVRNNAINYTDPTGHMGCKPNDDPNKQGYKTGNLCADQIKSRMKNRDNYCMSDKFIFEDCAICCIELSINLPESSIVASICLTGCKKILESLKKEYCCKN